MPKLESYPGSARQIKNNFFYLLSSWCGIYDKDSAFCKSTQNWKSDHKNMVKVLGFLLGFYTATVMKRWWSQISHMPMITDVTMVLNGT